MKKIGGVYLGRKALCGGIQTHLCEYLVSFGDNAPKMSPRTSPRVPWNTPRKGPTWTHLLGNQKGVGEGLSPHAREPGLVFRG